MRHLFRAHVSQVTNILLTNKDRVRASGFARAESNLFKHAEDSLPEHAAVFDWGTKYKQVSLKRT